MSFVLPAWTLVRLQAQWHLKIGVFAASGIRSLLSLRSNSGPTLSNQKGERIISTPNHRRGVLVGIIRMNMMDVREQRVVP